MKPPFSESDTIFATGVFLAPLKRLVHGTEEWCWIAVGFEDDSFLNGECINPNESADKLEDLVEYFEDDEEDDEDDYNDDEDE